MSPIYQIEPLARGHRTVFFYFLLLLFVIVVPILVLYANGYRLNLFDEEPTVVLTGGFYIATFAEDSQIFVNDRPVENTRFFRQATYVQGVHAGMHTIHVQGEGLQTWVKELPVYPQIVTEVSAFTIPVVPQVRPITSFLTLDGEPVFLGYETLSELPFSFASTTVSVTYSSSTSSVGWEDNPEFVFLETRFTDEVRPQWPIETPPRFRFATTTPSEVVVATTTATSTVVRNNVALVRDGDDVVAEYRGPIRSIPYYYCVPTSSLAVTTKHYGEHVAASLETDPSSATTAIFERGSWLGQTCRSNIRLDRRQQSVAWFDFVPGSTDLVILQLEDGIYVTEIDDRAWQNHQLLYPRGDVEVLVDGGQIFVRDGDYFAELFLRIPN